jgi:putative flippase GtrA
MEEDKFLNQLRRLGAPQGVLARVQIVKFIIVGGMASVVHLAVLALLTEVAEVWYVVATTVGFGAGFGVSFTLQK